MIRTLALAAALLAALFTIPVSAQAPARTAPMDRAIAQDPVEILLERLEAAGSAEEAKQLEREIWAAWLVSGSDTIDLLMQRAIAATQAKAYPIALQILDSIVELKPDYAEGWNKRATVHFLMKNYGESLGDIEKTLELQPRHFGALSGLGMIFRDVDDKAGALEAFRQALRVHPYLSEAQKAVDDLAEDVEGRGI